MGMAPEFYSLNATRTLVESVVSGRVGYPPKDENRHWNTIHSATLRVVCDRLFAVH